MQNEQFVLTNLHTILIVKLNVSFDKILFKILKSNIFKSQQNSPTLIPDQCVSNFVNMYFANLRPYLSYGTLLTYKTLRCLWLIDVWKKISCFRPFNRLKELLPLSSWPAWTVRHIWRGGSPLETPPFFRLRFLVVPFPPKYSCGSVSAYIFWWFRFRQRLLVVLFSPAFLSLSWKILKSLLFIHY